MPPSRLYIVIYFTCFGIMSCKDFSNAREHCAENNKVLPHTMTGYTDIAMIQGVNSTWLNLKKTVFDWRSIDGTPVKWNPVRSDDKDLDCAYMHYNVLYAAPCLSKKRYICAARGTTCSVCNGRCKIFEEECPVLSKDLQNWFTADRLCRESQSFLLVPDKTFPDILREKDEHSNQFWIGVHRSRWHRYYGSTEIPITTRFFNNAADSRKTGECAYMDVTLGAWYPAECKEEGSFICLDKEMNLSDISVNYTTHRSREPTPPITGHLRLMISTSVITSLFLLVTIALMIGMQLIYGKKNPRDDNSETLTQQPEDFNGVSVEIYSEIRETAGQVDRVNVD